MVNVAIIGAKGYAGKELVRLCLRHPEIRLVALTDLVEQPQPVSEQFPEFRGLTELMIEPTDVDRISTQAEAIFLALPHRVSQEYVAPFIHTGRRVFDLSADFRFTRIETYEQTYAIEHKEKELAKKAVYGLAEFNRNKIKDAQLIAVPGCYPTGALLGILPIVRAGVRLDSPIIVDAKSGVSGAGRKPTETTHFPECNESIMAYAVGHHRHQPEIEEKIHEAGGENARDVRLIFTPHLIPMTRGILSTIYLSLAEEVAEQDIARIFQEHYGGEFFIRLLPAGKFPTTKAVTYTNFCDIGWKKVAEHLLIVITAIDNLVKGASGQAVQCFNICYGFPEQTGLV
ncbi:N-acetyl-gamma-glutamyl-phosphate reductase [Candidatus Sumerlaeota bacterium]|nr:N-acetyl-gamma-glutamyl-phosphate reductase [Candidatus Sumerlaeota bacterium]